MRGQRCALPVGKRPAQMITTLVPIPRRDGELDLIDADERERPFYRDLTKAQLDSIKVVVSRLFGWKFWKAADDEIDNAISGNKSAVKQWFRQHGLGAGYLLGASE